MGQLREFALPDLGEGLEDGEIVEWLVAVGDQVALNQTVATVESAKALVELPSPFEGRVTDICAPAGDTVPVGTVLMRIAVDVTERTTPASAGPRPTDPDAAADPKPLVGYGTPADGARARRRRAAGAPTPTAACGPRETRAPQAVVGPVPLADATGPHPRARALPPVRKFAKLNGIDLPSLAPGSGPNGRILRQDVEAALRRARVRAAPGQPAAVGEASPLGNDVRPGFRGRYPGEVETIRGIRKRIVAKMEESRATIPDASCARDTDFTALWQLRAVLNEQAKAEGREGVRITPLAFISRATVVALRRFPTLNSRFDADAGEIRLLEEINLGMAVDTDSGLMVPNIKHAERLSVLEFADEAARLAARCRSRDATPEDLTGGTFTVNNYGSFGNDDGDPIINAPESAILGIGAIRERAWVVDSQLAVRTVARLKLVFDHRVCDGGEAARFIDYLAQLCEEPARLLLHA